MRAVILSNPSPVEEKPLQLAELVMPAPAADEILLKVDVCGICHTDLHIVEGEIVPPSYPIVPGHQVVGRVVDTGKDVTNFKEGDTVGLAWLRKTCGACRYCTTGRENLCPDARFNGFHANGGYAEYVTAPAEFAYAISDGFSAVSTAVSTAPLLCAGIIGYRALSLTGVKKGDRLALYGFGASAHVTIQIARHLGCQVYVFSRGEKHRALARSLGAEWTGTLPERPDEKMDGSIIFAPVGHIVPDALEMTAPGGTVALAGIYMTNVPELDYDRHIYRERRLISVTNSTRRDGVELLRLAAEIPIETATRIYSLDKANEALLDLKEGKIKGAGVLLISDEV